MFCKTCGNQTNPGDMHCSRCGASLVDNNSNNNGVVTNNLNVNDVSQTISEPVVNNVGTNDFSQTISEPVVNNVGANDFSQTISEPVVNNISSNEFNQNVAPNDIYSVPNNANNMYGTNNMNTVNYGPNVSYQNQKKKSGFGKTYLKMLGIAFVWFLLFTVIGLILKTNSTNPEEYSNIVLTTLQMYVPIMLIMLGWIPSLVVSAMEKQTDETKKKKFKIALYGVAIFFVAVIVAMVLTVANSKKFVCTSSQASITILYNDTKITGYTANNINFDQDAANEVVKAYGLNTYFSQFKVWFEQNTTGTCRFE